MYEYIGILLGARPILHISRIKVNANLAIFSGVNDVGAAGLSMNLAWSYLPRYKLYS
jgi:hypothetical protein